jgi:hypothetical protein
MTTTINASNSGGGGLVQTADASGILALQTAGVTALTIDASQNVTLAGTLTSTGVTTVQAGTAALPAITTSGDTNTGIFFPAADTIAFAEGGAEAMRIDSSGNVLIGQTSVTGDGEKVSISNTTTSGSVYNTTLRLVSTTTGAGSEAKMMFSLGGASTGISYISSQLEGAGYGNLIFATRPNGGNTTERMRIDSGGNVRIGTTTNAALGGEKVSIEGGPLGIKTTTAECMGLWSNRATGTYIAFYATSSGTNTGNITTNGTTTTYATSSDYRLKNTVTPMTGALAKVAALKPVTYKWNSDGSTGEGFLAHELQAIIPDCVTGEKDAVNVDGNIIPQGIDTSFLVATLTAAIQEQQALITSLTARIAALEGTPA